MVVVAMRVERAPCDMPVVGWAEFAPWALCSVEGREEAVIAGPQLTVGPTPAEGLAVRISDGRAVVISVELNVRDGVEFGQVSV